MRQWMNFSSVELEQRLADVMERVAKLEEYVAAQERQRDIQLELIKPMFQSKSWWQR